MNTKYRETDYGFDYGEAVMLRLFGRCKKGTCLTSLQKDAVAAKVHVSKSIDRKTKPIKRLA